MSLTYLYESSDEESLETDVIVNKGEKVVRCMDIVYVSENDNSDTSDNNTILPQMKNNITFEGLGKQTQRNLMLRIKQLSGYHNAEITSENNKINFDECLNYAKNFTQYQLISSFQNAILAFKCYSKKNDIIVNEKIYKQYKSLKILESNKDDIKRKLFNHLPQLKHYKDDIDHFYVQKDLIEVQTSDIIKWSVSACMIAHKHKIKIDIKKHFPHYKFYAAIHQEIVYHGFDYPLHNKVKTYWHTKLLKENLSYASKHKKIE